MSVRTNARIGNSGLGVRIKEARTEKGLAVHELARMVDKSSSYLSMLETFDPPPPAFGKTIMSLAKALDIDSDELMLLAGKIPEDARPSTVKDIRLCRKVLSMEDVDKDILLQELDEW